MISVLANIMPFEMHMICQYFFEGELEKSRNMQLELISIMNAMFMDVNPVPVKAALSMLELCEETYRLPLTRMQDKDKEILKQVMKICFPHL